VTGPSHSLRSQAGSRQPLLQALLVIVLSGASYAWALSFLPSRDTIARQLSVPEAMLTQALMEIADNRVSAALNQIDKLLSVSPNFRLAQLIKGDLLMAHARPISTLGAANGAPADRVADLREEARARLARYAFEPPRNLAPRYLLQLPASDRYALVVDASRSTLFVFENSGGTPRYVADYYVTVGKNGAAKMREGDKRTPLGVYRVTGRLPRDGLADLYGAGAFPISYPNEWDRLHGRSGSGIWLHGTPHDTYSRPPRASDGCVVLTNEDLAAVEKYLQLGRTPILIAERIDWSDAEDISALRGDLVEQIELWRRDWESRNTDNYLRHYSRRFAANGTDYGHWAAQKKMVNGGKSWIRVQVQDLSLMLYPGEKDLAVATFLQDYSSNNLSNQMKKRQYWQRENGRWRIVYEGAA